MKRIKKTYLFISLFMLIAFAAWTIILKWVDVQAVGPNGSKVGFATMNLAVHKLTGVSFALYQITDWLGLIPFGFITGFGVLGLFQWIRRRKLSRVDCDILILGGYYLVVFAFYLFFEFVVINYRPVLIAGILEASYPSSTTMLVICVIPTTIMQLHERIKSQIMRRVLSIFLTGFMAFMVIGRLLSGVHWLSDIIGGMLLSIGLVLLYLCFATYSSGNER